MKRWLNIAASIFGLIAAVFWFFSAYEEIPHMVTYWGSTPSTDPFYRAVRFSAVMNTWAASFSCLSAACMGVAGFVKSPSNWRPRFDPR